MPQMYTSQLTMPVEHRPISMRNIASTLNSVVTLTCSDAAGADVMILHCTTAIGLSKVAVQFVGDPTVADPTSPGTDDTTGIHLQWTSANIPVMFYAGRAEGGGKKKILGAKIYSANTGGTIYAQFIDITLGNELNG